MIGSATRSNTANQSTKTRGRCNKARLLFFFFWVCGNEIKCCDSCCSQRLLSKYLNSNIILNDYICEGGEHRKNNGILEEI